jgi:hypothetical protein
LDCSLLSRTNIHADRRRNGLMRNKRLDRLLTLRGVHALNTKPVATYLQSRLD